MCLCPHKDSQARECLLTASPVEEDGIGGSSGGLGVGVEGRKYLGTVGGYRAWRMGGKKKPIV